MTPASGADDRNNLDGGEPTGGNRRAHRQEAERHGITPVTLMVGPVAALVVLGGEVASAAVNGDVFTSLFFTWAVPLYWVAGSAIAIASAAVTSVAARLGLIGREPRSRFAAFVAVSCAACLLFQGAIFINDFILSGHPVVDVGSLALDTVWGGFSILVAAGLYVFLRGGRRRGAVVAALLALGSAAFAVSSLYTVLPRPFDVDLSIAAGQVGLTMLITGPALVAPLAASFAAGRRSDSAVLTVGAASAACLAVAAVLVSQSIPTQWEDRGGTSVRSATGPNVVLIVLDTVRADALSCYGSPFPTTPRLEELAQEATLVPKCYSTANWTPPGHASIFTGRYPASHGTHRVPVEATDQTNCLPLAEDEVTLAELLNDAGYTTAGFAANYAWVSHHYALDQGFRFWFDRPPLRVSPILLAVLETVAPPRVFELITRPRTYRRAAEMNGLVERWLDTADGRPFFLFINFMDAHHPYLPPPPWNRAMVGPVTDVDHDLEGWRQSTRELSSEQWRNLRSQYDGEIAYLDGQLGSLFDELRARGLFDSSIIVVTGDHGEFFGEHGLRAHRIGLYPPVTRVPLIIKPTAAAGQLAVEDRVVSTVDILPTLLEMLGMEVPSRIQGSSLLGPGPGLAFAQHYNDGYVSRRFGDRFNRDQLSIITGGAQYVIDSAGREEYYDLVADPERDLLGTGAVPAGLDELRRALEGWRRATEVRDVTGIVPPKVAPGHLDQLKALGYVH